jgi:hypothetical protein
MKPPPAPNHVPPRLEQGGEASSQRGGGLLSLSHGQGPH